MSNALTQVNIISLNSLLENLWIKIKIRFSMEVFLEKLCDYAI